MKFLYVVDYWVPFPSSEYGGVINVIAKNDVECHDLLLGVGHDDTYDNLIMAAVSRAVRFGLVDAEESRIVGEFVT